MSCGDYYKCRSKMYDNNTTKNRREVNRSTLLQSSYIIHVMVYYHLKIDSGMLKTYAINPKATTKRNYS